jgi:hypothetical protein
MGYRTGNWGLPVYPFTLALTLTYADLPLTA